MAKKTLDPRGVRIPNKDGSIGFTARLHFWKGRSSVRAFVTLRNLDGRTNDWTDNKIQFGVWYADSARMQGNYLADAVNFDLDLAPRGSLKYRIGGGNEGSEEHCGELAGKAGSVALYQDSSAGWVWQAGTGRVWDDRLKRNIEFMKAKARSDAAARGGDPEAAAARALPFYEYSDYVFNELIRRRDGGSFMGYRLYRDFAEPAAGPGSGFADLGREAAEGLRAPGWIEVDDGAVAVLAGCRWFWQMFPKSLEARTPGRISVGLWSQYYPRGHLFEGRIHKTHELVFDFRASGAGPDGAARFKALTQPLVAVPDARHNLASRAYGDFMLPNREEWPNYEMSALAAVVSCLDTNKNPGFASSLQIEREKQDIYDVWKFGDSIKDAWHHFGQYSELDAIYCLMIHFARTGDLRFYRAAEEFGRSLLDVPAHGGGYGHQHGESSHYYVYGPLLFADAAAEPFLRDAILAGHAVANPAPWHLRSCAITLWANWSLYNGFETNRPAWQAGMRAGVDSWRRFQNRDTGAMGGFSRPSQIFFLGLAGDAMGRYCETFPDDKPAREALVRGMAEYMAYFKGLPPDRQKAIRDDSQEKSCANGLAYATRFSGDPAYLDFAASELVKDSAFPTHFRNGNCSTKMWSETRSAHRLIQVFMHDVDRKRHPERYRDLP
jgi:hypothetical protein